VSNITNYPFPFLALCLVVFWLSALIGAYFRGRQLIREEAEHEDLGVVLAATLTLLGLIIGFSFSMAVSRYDLRKDYEEEEADAIGTEYIRADLLPAADAAKVRKLLRSYLDQRVLFYTTSNARQLEQISAATAQLQTDLWAAVRVPAAAQPTSVSALAVSGVNDVLSTQEKTQASYLNRIPVEAWGLLGAIAVCCNLLVGYHARRTESKHPRFFILPLVVAVSFFLIADLDSPRHGLIQVRPQNLVSLSASLPSQ
jgi:hypothetical protein